MAIYTEFVTSLNIALEYNTATKIVTAIQDVNGKEVEYKIGSMTEDGIKLDRRNQTTIALKKVADRLWSKSHKNEAEIKKLEDKATRQKQLTEDLLALRKAVNNAAKDSKLEIKAETNGKAKDAVIVGIK